MSRAPLVRALIALGIVAGSLYVTVTTPARLGLDLRGGTQIVLETQDSPTVKADKESTDRALEVLRRRVDALGVAEPTLTRSGDRRIIVELPGVQDPREAAEVIGRTAQLTFHPVLGVAAADARAGSDAHAVAPADRRRRAGAARRGRPAGPARPGRRSPARASTDAAAELDPQGLGSWYVSRSTSRGSGGDGVGRAHRRGGLRRAGRPDAPGRDRARRPGHLLAAGRPVGRRATSASPAARRRSPASSPRRRPRTSPSLIKGGALPVPVEVIEQRTVGPTLGAAAIEASAKAAVIGVALTALFIIVVYRLLGGLAAVALGCYALISYAALVALGATLTLPGLAGFVLAIGMAIDANVLVFERAREEYAAQRPQEPAAGASPPASRKAWSAIIDSNVTTLLAAGLLFFLASGPVRGLRRHARRSACSPRWSPRWSITRVLADWAVRRPRRRRAGPRVTGIAAPGRVRDLADRAATPT